MQTILNFAFCLIISITSISLSIHILKKGRFDPASGFVLGFCYFIGAPITQLLLLGQINDAQIGLPALTISSKTYLFAYLFLGCLATVAIYYFPYHKKKLASRFLAVTDKNLTSYYKFILLIYVILATFTFISSGKAAGGHWMENNHELYSSSTAAVISGNFYNVLRVIIPGILLYCHSKSIVSKKNATIILIIFSALELVISSNRIILLFSLIALAGIYRVQMKRFILIAALMAPLLLEFNALFPMIRGLMWSEGASLEQTKYAIETGYSTEDTSESKIGKTFNSAFESSNILVMRYALEKYQRSENYLLGETIYIKSLTFFLPKTLWENKPSSFNARMGYDISGSNVLSLNSTLLGEAFGNFSWFGAFVYLFNAIVFCSILLLPKGRILTYAGFFVAFASWRFEFSFLAISIFSIACITVAFNAYQSLAKRLIIRKKKQTINFISKRKKANQQSQTPVSNPALHD